MFEQDELKILHQVLGATPVQVNQAEMAIALLKKIENLIKEEPEKK
jgi:hypothetical protein